ncbi:MAG TPA: MBL fold metallo-hydrolase [Geminicoccaceae bacterium]|nr:MBL fold metallo-hydrolase [Geminicoccaceae bacterium]
MRVRFWGTRGSIAKPGPSTTRYGGNTGCVEVRSAAGTLVVLDCGTGAHGLGQALMAAGPRPLRGHILISHTHWDHIQGIPFFAPLFVPGNEWDIYAPRGLAQGLRDTLAGQMQYTYFPLALEQLGAEIRYHDLVEGAFRIGDIDVRTRYLNHPALTLGYRLEADGVSLVYASDHEPYSPRLASGSGEISGRDQRHAEFLAGADLVIHDAQYTAGEYADKAGWGHSTVEYAIAVSRHAGARRLALTHHDPLRDDDALDRIIENVRAGLGEGASSLDVFAAAEGGAMELKAAVDAGRGRATNEFSAVAPVPPALGEQSVLLGMADPTAAGSISEALGADGIRVVLAPDGDAALRAFQSEQPSLVILERHLPGVGGLEVCRAIRGAATARASEVPVIVVADQEDVAAGAAAGVTDWLVRPFSSVYARTRARAWLLRTRCRWVRAPVPEDEERRLGAVHRLGLLDTRPEERFDRLTRLAAALFDVPIALVSLVDRDRQWFKSCQGPSAKETSREISFCAHAILGREVMVVPDALLDPRFADNPFVTGEPHIRFYAGYPLVDACGSCVGTLCLVDTRPHQLDEAGIRLLQDLGSLVQRELSAAPTFRAAEGLSRAM